MVSSLRVSKASERKSDEEPGFEAALARLEEIVGELEDGELPLDDAIARFEEGVRLAKRCRDLLAKAEARILELTGTGEERALDLASEGPS